MTNYLSDYFQINRRYSRSINLERDLENIDALDGYIFTERSLESLRRILTGFQDAKSNRAWTLTSVYGTGKSAFAHYLSAVCAPENQPIRQRALEIAAALGQRNPVADRLLKNMIPDSGFVRAVVTAQREPLSHTIVRALYRGSQVFWGSKKGKKPAIAQDLAELCDRVKAGEIIDSKKIPALVQEVAKAAQTGVLLIIDELGKNLEFVAQNQGNDDLYLLQQLAELPRSGDSQIYIIGLLHQAFADYGERLASVQRNEWAKIQGRFEDIPFKDSASQMLRLMGQAIEHSPTPKVIEAISNQAQKWFKVLPSNLVSDVTDQGIAAVYPLHPVAALVLPELCTQYAQNDRSLFTFLTSDEPYSFQKYLRETFWDVATLPSLKLDRIYDYFIESVGMGITSRPKLQRWIEVQGLINDVSKSLDADSLRVLKTIGTLNIVTTTGALKATRSLVTMAMCDRPNDRQQFGYWEKIIDGLLNKGIITHRRQVDELRIWQGSDFNVDRAIADLMQSERGTLVNLLSEFRPLKPLVAQRHSYETGTLRYFERRYIDATTDLSQLNCAIDGCDGLMGYWVDEAVELATDGATDVATDGMMNGATDILGKRDKLSAVSSISAAKKVPVQTADGKPFIMICAAKLENLRLCVREFVALKKIQESAPELQSDGVARREVRYRLVQAEELLDDSLSQGFDVVANHSQCWIDGQPQLLSRVTDLNAKLSEVCDRIYPRSLILWNELINRRELTTQGAAARLKLISAMLEHQSEEKLGLEGYGPEVAIYYSLLADTGIHRQEAGEWGFYPPREESGVGNVWQAIADFCGEAIDKQLSLDLLYQRLAAPPFGVKQGAIPILLAAMMLYRVDDLGVYKDGTFIPILGLEHFELLVKYPGRFSVKSFEMLGVRSQVFKELEEILRRPNAKLLPGLRNATLLTVVRPLFNFVRKLPAYTKNTKRLSQEAIAVLATLQTAQEPDELLFTSLPQACGMKAIETGESDDGTTAKTLRKKLVHALHEIQTAFDCLLTECQNHLYDAFGVRSTETKLREDLRVRASYLAGQVLERQLKSFVQVAVDDTAPDSEWLQALVMIVADKPAESWKDEDAIGFELKLSDIARRFKNLEALQKEVAAKGQGFEARRITVTRPDGEEAHQIVWVDHESEEQIEALVDEILQKPLLQNNPQLQQALLAKLSDRILGSAASKQSLPKSDRQTPRSINL
ncbi:hypothetical protein [Planktothricoides raciborskii]|nr:hypothetical protein [Planktothricoides raciborskii]